MCVSPQLGKALFNRQFTFEQKPCLNISVFVRKRPFVRKPSFVDKYPFNTPMRFYPLALLALLLALGGACLHDKARPVAYAYVPTPVDGWETGDTLHFTVDSLPRTAPYNVAVGLRTSAAQPFPYRSLWLVVRERWTVPALYDQMADSALLMRLHAVRAADSTAWHFEHTDTVQLRLTDAEGDVVGEGISRFQYVFTLHTHVLPRGARADVSIFHLMRRDMLPGITDVGIMLTPTD